MDGLGHMDRLTFLARLRESLSQGTTGPAAPRSESPRPAGQRPGAQGSPADATSDRQADATSEPQAASAATDLVALFAERLRASGGEVAVVGSKADAWAALGRLAGERGWRTVACAPGLRPGAAAAAKAASAGLDFTLEVGDADIGLGEADWAVAETGSVVVKASAEVRRGYSLVPAAVGFFVPRSRLRATMGEVLRELPVDAESLPSCVSFISGPSGTSDLAAVHVVGVHGPGEVFVWVIEDGRPPA
jgi:L-lactate dehydrogenase complex protein LldG